MRRRIIGTASSTIPAMRRRPTTNTLTAKRRNRVEELFVCAEPWGRFFSLQASQQKNSLFRSCEMQKESQFEGQDLDSLSGYDDSGNHETLDKGMPGAGVDRK